MQGPPSYKSHSQGSQSFDMNWEWEPPPGSRFSDRLGSPPTPTSLSSHSTGRESTSGGMRPPQQYKSFTPSPSVAALSKLSDDDLRRKGMQDLVQILRRVESDYKALMSEHGHIMKDVNRRIQIISLEMKSLKEMNEKLQEDNQELRDLCCFLDDDRQKSRKLAREWQRFGRYTASVMRSEVAAYQEKLRELEGKQDELITDNLELKELCLFLDTERHPQGDRDEGDGSSNSTTTGHEDGHHDRADHPMPPARQDNAENSTSVYIRQLEERVRHLEEEKKQLAQRAERSVGDGFQSSEKSSYPAKKDANPPPPPVQPRRNGSGSTWSGPPSHGGRGHRSSPGKPEAVVHAMKVLQVHEQLERAQDGGEEENLDDREKAIVREMCNVVWKKLGDGASSERNPSHQSPPPGPPPPRSGPPVHPSPTGLVGMVHPAVSSQPTSLPSYYPHHTPGGSQAHPSSSGSGSGPGSGQAPGSYRPGAVQFQPGSHPQQPVSQPVSVPQSSAGSGGMVPSSRSASLPPGHSDHSHPSSLPPSHPSQPVVPGGGGVSGGTTSVPSQSQPHHSGPELSRYPPSGQSYGLSSLPNHLTSHARSSPFEDGPASLTVPPRVPAAPSSQTSGFQPAGQIPLGQGQIYQSQGHGGSYHSQTSGFPQGSSHHSSLEPPPPPPPSTRQQFHHQEWRQKFLDPRGGQQ